VLKFIETEDVDTDALATRNGLGVNPNSVNGNALAGKDPDRPEIVIEVLHVGTVL